MISELPPDGPQKPTVHEFEQNVHEGESAVHISGPDAHEPAPSGVVIKLASVKKTRKASAGAAALDTGAGEDKQAGRKKDSPPRDWGKYNFLLENFTLIYPTDTVWDASKRKIVKISNMAHAHSSEMVRMWKAAENRKTVDDHEVVFDPTYKCPPHYINLYDGFSTKPMLCTGEDDVKPMLDLLRHLCSSSASAGVTVEDVMHWVLCWLALPLQQPGAKLRTALVFHGPQGTGKNMFFDVIRKMYGKYGVMVGQNELEEKFNDWLSGKLLVIGNEVVTRQELFHNKNKLKWIITEDQIPIRAMQQSVRWESNHANVVFLSNESMPLVLEDGDRRHLVVYTPLADETGLYTTVQAFLEADGAAVFMDYLMCYDLQEFNEHTKPLITQAKVDLQELSMKPSERFMAEWLEGFIPLPVRVCSGEQLYRAFETWARRSGLRWTDESAKFTSQVKRWVNEHVERDAAGQRLEPRMEYKVIQLRNAMADNGRRAVRCWLPRGTGPLNGVSLGEWAADAVQTFELPLGRYLRERKEDGQDSSVPE